MMTMTVRVRRQWNSHLEAEYPLEALEGVHWSTVSGGVGARAPRPFLHGYVMCDGMLAGELAHSCLHGDGPHRVKVCVVAKANTTAVMNELKRRAG